MKILLICAAGMSTSLLVQNMLKFADQEDLIEALPEGKLESVIDNYDIVLVGPQIRYKFAGIQKIAKAHNKAAELIDMKSYGAMDGEVVMKQAKDLFNKK